MIKTSSRMPPYRHSLAGTLLAAREAIMGQIRPYLREAGVTEQQWRVLRVLSDEGPLEPTRLAEVAMLHAPSVTRILKELGDRGFTRRERDPDDGRRSIVAISLLGHGLLDETSAHTIRVIDRLSDRFGRDRLSALLEELRAFAEFVPSDATGPSAERANGNAGNPGGDRR